MKIKGFSASAVQAKIRYSDRLDLGLIYSEVPAVTAGVFTTSKVKAAPVLLDIERLQQGKAQAILVNSGNANACTGDQGMETAIATGAMAASQLGIDENLVQVASTGVIGESLNPGRFAEAMPELVEKLSSDGFVDLSEAIMTTDTVAKMSTATVNINGTEVHLLGVAKGSGMIMPNMATMLCFVVTDAQIAFTALKEAIRQGVEETFNKITIDGDTSTNDTVLVMANGAAGNDWIDEENPAGQESFSEVLLSLFKDLALQIVADGEGATKVVTIRVAGAREKRDAMNAAKTIANSALVKTAFFGEDANWGRIIAALGRSDCQFSPDKVSIAFDDVVLVENGIGQGADVEELASAVLKHKDFTVTIDLHDGTETAEVFTCDLSYDYVKINADYRS
jgi:glutamate N-acetyltransferase/amino-acid N-acetyltransferase